MLDELARALGLSPALQAVLLGVMVIAAAVGAIAKGMANSNRDRGEQQKDRRSEWEAYKQLENIEANSFRLVELQQKTIDAINRLTDNIWNRKQF